MKRGRGGEVPAFVVMDVIARANALARSRAPDAPPVLRLEVGQPALGAPLGARRAVAAALRAGQPMGYTETLGLPGLRRRIAAHYRAWYGLDLAPDRIAITGGASGAFPLAFLACFDPGDRIAMAAPYYPPYLNILTALGMHPVIVPTQAQGRYQLDVAALERLRPRPHGIIVASPSNPAGTMLVPDELAALAAWCTGHGVRLISDEIYHGLSYGAPLATAASFSASAIVINSFSKYFCMSGWRIGWMVMPEDLARPIERLAQNMMISAPHMSQIAAEAALGCHHELQRHVATYRRSRDRLIAAMPQAWFHAPPQGAFYLYADLGEDGDSASFCDRLLSQHAIACSPGLDFDAQRGRRTVRFSYAGPEAAMAEAADRLARLC